jgi:hypothetical protein
MEGCSKRSNDSNLPTAAGSLVTLLCQASFGPATDHHTLINSIPVPHHADAAVPLIADGALYLCSPIDPLLLLLPHLVQVW